MSLAVYINDDDFTSTVVFKSLQIRDNLNQQVDTCSYVMRKVHTSNVYVPKVNDWIRIERNGSNIFLGIIIRVTETIKAANILEYKIEASDWSQILKKKLVTERYANMTVTAIINDIVTTYLTDPYNEYLTTTNVTSTLVIESISFNRLTIADCLQKLADAINYVWYVDYDFDLHFFEKNDELAPFSLTDTSENYIYDSLEIVEDLTQIRNSVLVQGGETVSAGTRTEEFDGDGTKDVFRLANKFSTTPTVTVGGVSKTVGTEYLDDDASFDCMWNFNEKYIRFTAGNIPASGTNNVDVTGYYLYPIVVKVPSPASQTLYGVYEFAITDKSIRSQDEAIKRAHAELESYKNSIHEGQFRTYTDGLRSGQVLTINSTKRNKGLSVLIQSVSATMRDPLGDTLEYTVRFATMKSIGIIEYLQNQLRSKEVIIDDYETILTYNQLTDTITSSDTLAAPTADTGPYVWDTMVWGYFTWG